MVFKVVDHIFTYKNSSVTSTDSSFNLGSLGSVIYSSALHKYVCTCVSNPDISYDPQTSLLMNVVAHIFCMREFPVDRYHGIINEAREVFAIDTGQSTKSTTISD